MEVEVVEVSSGKIVGIYDINIRSLNSETAEEEYFAEAWRCAVEDRVAKAQDRSKYRFQFRK